MRSNKMEWESGSVSFYGETNKSKSIEEKCEEIHKMPLTKRCQEAMCLNILLGQEWRNKY